MSENTPAVFQNIYSEIKETLLRSRDKAYKAVNSAMVQAYWQIGRIIVEHEQDGSLRAEYGKRVLQHLSDQLTEEFGKGFDVRNLRYMRAFYIAFPKWNAVRSELTWTHYRTLLRVEDEAARQWYMEECIRSAWSSRQLERQISINIEMLCADRSEDRKADSQRRRTDGQLYQDVRFALQKQRRQSDHRHHLMLAEERSDRQILCAE